LSAHPVSDYTPIGGFLIELGSGPGPTEGTMDRLTRITQQADRPGRLQLAIIEWQRQLIAKREIAKREARLADEDRSQAA
jgi:hypothetical protein